jgi:hypothetical protein
MRMIVYCFVSVVSASFIIMQTENLCCQENTSCQENTPCQDTRSDAFEKLRIPDAKKEYILSCLEPILEPMVAACLSEMPEDPATFMIDYLTKTRPTECVPTVLDEETRLAELDTILCQSVLKFCTSEVRAQLCDCLTSQTFAEGQVISCTTSTETTGSFCIVASGSCKVTADDDTSIWAQKDTNDWFMCNDCTEVNTVTALCDTTLLCLPCEDFERLVDQEEFKAQYE